MSLPHSNPALQQKGADLIDDARALADQPLTNAMERLQIELIGSLCRHELHGGPLHRLGNRLCVAEVVLLPLRIGTHVLCRHQPGVVAKPLELATEMMGADACLHADEARRHVGEPHIHLASRPLLPQHDRAAGIKADNVERVLADIDANHSDRAVELL